MGSIAFQGVEKVFSTRVGPVTALENIDLAVEDSEFVSIVGASGCGKSTMLNLVAGFEQPTRGLVCLDTEPIRAPGPDRGVVFQEIALFPWLTVRENVAFGLTLKANAGAKPNTAGIDELLHRVGLLTFQHQYPAQLSGGMRQRVAIARVLAIDSSVLLMDEPFGALDALTRSLMQDFLLEIWEENQKTVLFVTHDIDEAIYLSHRVVVMSSRPGRVRRIVPIDLPRPRDYHVRSLPLFAELREEVTTMVREEALNSHHVASSR